MKEPMFDEALIEAELSTWQSLKPVVTNFLGNHRSAEYEKEIEKPLKSFRQLEARMSVKLHFLQSHLDFFSKNCGDLHEEQGEHFHQDIRIMEELLPKLWDVNFLDDYSWYLRQDVVATEQRKKSLKRPFIHE